MAQETLALSGKITAINDRGLKVLESDWLNYTKTTSGPTPSELGEGDHVTVSYQVGSDGKSWLRRVGKGSVEQTQRTTPAPAATGNGNGHISERDLLNARMSALKSATKLASAHPEATSAQCLATAERFLAWLQGQQAHG